MCIFKEATRALIFFVFCVIMNPVELVAMEKPAAPIFCNEKIIDLDGLVSGLEQLVESKSDQEFVEIISYNFKLNAISISEIERTLPLIAHIKSEHITKIIFLIEVVLEQFYSESNALIFNGVDKLHELVADRCYYSKILADDDIASIAALIQTAETLKYENEELKRRAMQAVNSFKSRVEKEIADFNKLLETSPDMCSWDRKKIQTFIERLDSSINRNNK